METFLTDEQVCEPFKKHLFKINELFSESLIELNEILGMSSVKIYGRVKANLLHNIWVEKAKPYFRGYGIVIDESYDSALFGFEKGIVGRFKKLDKDTLLSSGICTDRSQRIVQGSLFPEEYPSNFTMTEFGYVIHPSWESYEFIYLIRRDDDQATILLDISSEVEKLNAVTAIEITPDHPALQIVFKKEA